MARPRKTARPDKAASPKKKATPGKKATRGRTARPRRAKASFEVPKPAAEIAATGWVYRSGKPGERARPATLSRGLDWAAQPLSVALAAALVPVAWVSRCFRRRPI